MTVTDSTGAFSTSGPLQIVVSSLAFTTTSPLPSGTVNVAYGGVQFAATGGTSPYTFALAAGSTLPPGLMLNAGDLTGTPTTVGSYSFGISVTDSGAPPAVITNTFTLVVNPVQDLTLLTGPYAFSFSGYDAAGFVAAAGAFTSDGNGNIKSGDADFTTLQGHKLYTGLTGTYTAGVDGRGTITFTSVAGMPTFAFAIDTSGSGHGRLIEFDATGTRGSGRSGGAERHHVRRHRNQYEHLFRDVRIRGFRVRQHIRAGRRGTNRVCGNVYRDAAGCTGDTGKPGEWRNGFERARTTCCSETAGTRYRAFINPERMPHTARWVCRLPGLSNPNYDVYPISSGDAFLIETDTVSGKHAERDDCRDEAAVWAAVCDWFDERTDGWRSEWLGAIGQLFAVCVGDTNCADRGPASNLHLRTTKRESSRASLHKVSATLRISLGGWIRLGSR